VPREEIAGVFHRVVENLAKEMSGNQHFLGIEG